MVNAIKNNQFQLKNGIRIAYRALLESIANNDFQHNLCEKNLEQEFLDFTEELNFENYKPFLENEDSH